MTTDWQDISVLIVGCGSIGKRHARCLADLGVRDIRACDPAASQRQALHEQMPTVRIDDDFEAGLSNRPGAVLLCTPPELHIEQASRAIEAGCHVLCEKPLSVSSRGIDSLQYLADSQDKKVMVAHCFRYHAGVVKAREALQSGDYGRCVSIRAMMAEHLPDVRPDYQSLHVVRHNGAFDLMHDIDLALWFADSSVRSVHSVCGSYSDLQFKTPDVVELLIDFEDRRVANVHLDFFTRPRTRHLKCFCTNGTIELEFARWDRCTLSTYNAQMGSWDRETIETERDDMFRDEDREFLMAVAEDRPVGCPVAEARKVVEVVESAGKGYFSNEDKFPPSRE